MLFNSVVVGALAVFSCVAAVPSRAAKRQEVDASNVIEQLNDLQSKLTPIENGLFHLLPAPKAFI